jgi:hypothetical protein
MGSAESGDFKGIYGAYDFLDVDRKVSDEDIKRAFKDIANDADGETYWKAFKAKEIALSDSTSVGKTVYTVLRNDIHPEDISSVAEAQSLLDAAPPPQDTRHSDRYYRGLSKMADDVEQRLKKLSEDSEFVKVKPNIQAVSVAHYALYYRDIEEAKRYVLGPDGCSAKSTASSSQDDLDLHWKYSVESAGDKECYMRGDETIHVSQRQNTGDPSATYVVSFSNEKGSHTEYEFNRYGEAKRKVKQWVLDPPNL